MEPNLCRTTRAPARGAGVVPQILSPGRGERESRTPAGKTNASWVTILSPLPGLSRLNTPRPTAGAVGYHISPLPGLRKVSRPTNRLR